MSEESSALIQLGFVRAPFGVRGWIKLRSHTDPPERLLEHRSLRIGHGSVWQNYRIEASGRSGGALTVKLAGGEDRDQAQVLMVVRGAQEFWIPAVPRHVRRVDLEARRVIVDWNTDGPA